MWQQQQKKLYKNILGWELTILKVTKVRKYMHMSVTHYNINHNRYDSWDIRAKQCATLQKAERYKETGFLQINVLHFKNPSKNMGIKKKKSMYRSLCHSCVVTGRLETPDITQQQWDSTILVTWQRLNY